MVTGRPGIENRSHKAADREREWQLSYPLARTEQRGGILPRAAGFVALLSVPSPLMADACPLALPNSAGEASTTFAVIGEVSLIEICTVDTPSRDTGTRDFSTSVGVSGKNRSGDRVEEHLTVRDVVEHQSSTRVWRSACPVRSDPK